MISMRRVKFCLVCAVALPVLVTGCSIPFSNIQLPVIQLGNVDFDPGGSADIQGTEEATAEICLIPSLQGLRGMAEEALENVPIITGIAITGLEVVELRLITTGDVSGITAVSLSFIAKDETETLLGEVLDQNGVVETLDDGRTGIVLAGQGVDFLQLIEENDASTVEGCPGVRFVATGILPSGPVTFATEIVLRASGVVTL